MIEAILLRWWRLWLRIYYRYEVIQFYCYSKRINSGEYQDVIVYTWSIFTDSKVSENSITNRFKSQDHRDQWVVSKESSSLRCPRLSVWSGNQSRIYVDLSRWPCATRVSRHIRLAFQFYSTILYYNKIIVKVRLTCFVFLYNIITNI